MYKYIFCGFPPDINNVPESFEGDGSAVVPGHHHQLVVPLLLPVKGHLNPKVSQTERTKKRGGGQEGHIFYKGSY